MLLWLSVGREGRIVPFVVVEWGREGDPRLGSASETRMQNLSEASEPTTKLLGNFFVLCGGNLSKDILVSDQVWLGVSVSL